MKKNIKKILLSLPVLALLIGCDDIEILPNTEEDTIIKVVHQNNEDNNGSKVINTDAIASSVKLFTYLPISSCYGTSGSDMFNITATITTPSKKVINTKKDFYINEEGVYSVTITCDFGGEIVEKTISVTAEGYSGEGLFTYQNANFIQDKKSVRSTLVKGPSSGVQISLGASASSITYNNIVDLNEVIGNLIEVSANDDSDTPGLVDLKFTVTDAYDPTISFSVYTTTNSSYLTPSNWKDHGAMNMFFHVSFYGYNVSDSSTYPALKNKTVAWDQCLFPYKGDYIPVGFIFDNDTNEVSIFGRKDAYGNLNAKTLLWDLDDPTDSLRDFKGFTTGEVYISIEGNGSSGNLNVLKIGNDVFSKVDKTNYSKDTGNALYNGYNFQNMFTGAVGYTYPLPDISYCNNDVQRQVFFGQDASRQEIQVQNYNEFVPTEPGDYSIRYTSKNQYGIDVVKEGNFHINDSASGINSLFSETIDVKLFETSTIPTFEFNGGNGELSKKVQLVLDDEYTDVEEGKPFTIGKKYKKAAFKVVVSDQIGQVKTFEYPINVDCNVIKFLLKDCFNDVSVMEGTTFEIPGYTAIDYSKEDCSKTNIPVSIRRGKTTAVRVGERINVDSDTEIGYYYNGELLGKLNLHCVPMDISLDDDLTSLERQYNGNTNVKSITTNSVGTSFAFNAGEKSSIVQPYAVSTTNLEFKFNVFTSYANYENIRVRLVSYGGNEVDIELSNFGSTPYLYVNGTKSNSMVSVERNVYSSTDDVGLNGESYYTYSFIFDSGTKTLYNSSLVEIENVDTWNNGDAFNGFEKGCAQVIIEFDNPKSGNFININKISNQNFTLRALSYGDLTAPSLAFEGEMSSSIVSLGDTYYIPKAYAYDVFDNSCDVTMKILDPDGEVIVSESEAQAYALTFTKYGSYSIIYKYSDSRDNFSTNTVIMAVADDMAPTITINGTYQETYSGSVKILTATVKDNYDPNAGLFVFLVDSELHRHAVTMGEEVKLEKGRYRIIYYAYDESGNTSTLEFVINVK